MKTQIVHFRRDAGHLLLPAQALPGEQGDGSIICAIDDCPDALLPERLLVRLQGLFPAVGVTRVSFTDLPVPDGGCCGGRCGGGPA